MRLLNRARAAFAAIFAAVFGAQPTQRFAYLNANGLIMSQDQALNISTAWACMELVAKSIAASRWRIYAPDKGGGGRRLLEEDPRTWLLNTRPNPENTAIGFWEGLFFQALAMGNSYAEIVFNKLGKPVQMWLLLTPCMQVKRNDAGTIEYHYNDGSGTRVLQPEQVFHLHGVGLDGLMGDNVVARMVKDLALAAAMKAASLQFYSRGGQLAGVLEYPGELNEPRVKQLREQWEENHAGLGNNYRPLILEGGMKFVPTSLASKDATTIEEKRFSVEEICRWFGVPLSMVQSPQTSGAYGNVEDTSINFVRFALRPWAVRAMQEADFKLFGGYFGPVRQTEIDLRPLQMGNFQSVASALSTLTTSGTINRNEAREMIGRDGMGPAGDVYTVQAQLVNLNRALEDKPAPAPQPTDPNQPPASPTENPTP